MLPRYSSEYGLKLYQMNKNRDLRANILLERWVREVMCTVLNSNECFYPHGTPLFLEQYFMKHVILALWCCIYKGRSTTRCKNKYMGLFVCMCENKQSYKKTLAPNFNHLYMITLWMDTIHRFGWMIILSSIDKW